MDCTHPVYVMRIVSGFGPLPLAFVDCAPTAAVTDMATTAMLNIQCVLILSLSSFGRLARPLITRCRVSAQIFLGIFSMPVDIREVEALRDNARRRSTASTL